MKPGPFEQVEKKFKNTPWWDNLDNIYLNFEEIDLNDPNEITMDNFFQNSFSDAGFDFQQPPQAANERKQWIVGRALSGLGWFLSAPFRGLFSLFKTPEVEVTANEFQQDPRVKDLNDDIKHLVLGFNENPIKACNKWLEGQNDEEKVASIVWLITKKAELLDPAQIGEILSQPGNDAKFKLSSSVLDSYLETRFDFKGKNIAESLKEFLEADFKLPGEAQKIDRFMQAFAQKFLSNNPEQQHVANQDAAYTLAFALVMLQTDLHNPSIKKKMSLEQFKSNLKECNNGQNFDPAFLESLYNYIKDNEIKMNLTEKSGLKPFPQQILDRVQNIIQMKKKPLLDKEAIAALKSHPDYDSTDPKIQAKMQGVKLAVQQSELKIGHSVMPELNLEEPLDSITPLKTRIETASPQSQQMQKEIASVQQQLRSSPKSTS